MKLNKVMAVMVVSSALVLSGCSAMGTAIKKRNLEVKTQMSETIWLEPSNNKTVYLQIKNTSDKDMSGLQAKLPAPSLQRDIRSSVTRIRRATGSGERA
ncbi:Lipoprotein YlpA [Klebsiella pneumoniae]|nr:Lipoprotein YlpA [Klebsiella pneumoniae]